MATVVLMMLIGCALHAHRTGIVSPDDGSVLIWEPEGRRTLLVLGEQSDPVRYLAGVEIGVDGPRLGRRLFVREWTVGLTETGAQPFVGVLTRFGSNWLMEDRVSGSTIMIDPDTMYGLRAHEGHMVLVEGFVAGPQEIRVVRWRALYDVPPGEPGSG